MTKRVELSGPQERLLRALSQGRADGAVENYPPRVKLLALGLVAPKKHVSREGLTMVSSHGLYLTQAGWAWLEAIK